MTHDDDKDLDALFAEARVEQPSPTLVARVAADAKAVQAQPAPKSAVPRQSWWAAAIAGIGGWSAVSGITAAGVMGLAVGLYSPDTVAVWLEGDTTLGSFELAPEVSGLWSEDGDV
jgi:hypothetical protein